MTSYTRATVDPVDHRAQYTRNLKDLVLQDQHLADKTLAELGYARVGVAEALRFLDVMDLVGRVKTDIDRAIEHCSIPRLWVEEKEKAPDPKEGSPRSQLEFDFEMDG